MLVQGLMAIIASIIGAFVTYLLTKRNQNSSDVPTAPDGTPLEHLDNKPPSNSIGADITLSRIFAGFLISVAAAFVWGTGNSVTRFSAEPYPEAVVDIAIIHYVVGALSLIFIGFLARSGVKKENQELKISSILTSKGIYGAAAFKSLNAYSWIFAVTLISASLAATIENLHVVWTAILVVLFLSQRISSNWIISAIVILCGVALISEVNVSATGLAGKSTGLFWAFVSSITFTLFALVWAKACHAELPFWHRCVEMGLFLLISVFMFIPIHLAISSFSATGIPPLFNSLPSKHLLIQALVGLFSIAITYMLMNEALVLMKGAGNLAALILGLGVSFAVLFTMVAEYFIFDEHVTLYQWIGVVLFSIGFAAIRNNLDNSERRNT